uniref:Ig-like domain-containing protein n=1 Tax=Oryzias melastigma TaxID=30732 RepID=A0A3B3BVG0_ORYME
SQTGRQLVPLKSEDDWKVSYYQTEICADKGSTVIIRCSYDYPEIINGVNTTVEKRFWFIRTEGEPVDLREDPEYKDRICYLRISGVRESDSAVYKFMFITNHQTGHHIGEPGVRITVLPVSTSVHLGYLYVQLKCFNRCDPKGLEEYVWFKNGEEIRSMILTSRSQKFWHKGNISSTDRISCSLSSSKTKQSPEVYAPQTPTVSLDPPTEILEGSSVTLTCSSDANPAANYFWYKRTNSDAELISVDPKFVLSSIQSSDSGEYYCKVQNQLGWETADIKLVVKYAPKSVSVSMNPPEILEDSSVTLTCSCDANPAASYTWFKNNQGLLSGGPHLILGSVHRSDSRKYHCVAENELGKTASEYVSINVECEFNKGTRINRILLIFFRVVKPSEREVLSKHGPVRCPYNVSNTCLCVCVWSGLSGFDTFLFVTGFFFCCVLFPSGEQHTKPPKNKNNLGSMKLKKKKS